jgi:hypothetical protein
MVASARELVMVRVLLSALAATLLSAAAADAQTQSAQPAAAPPALPTCSAAAHHALDFWIGEWDAFRADNNQLSGHSSITASDDGCVINEHWTSVGAPYPYSGRSLNTFDASTGKWEQYWADSTGSHIYFVGSVGEGGAISMATLGPRATGPNGAPQWQRVTLTPLPDGTVRQQGDTSADGRTWTLTYALIYRHRSE